MSLSAYNKRRRHYYLNDEFKDLLLAIALIILGALFIAMYYFSIKSSGKIIDVSVFKIV